jgi:galactokinase
MHSSAQSTHASIERPSAALGPFSAPARVNLIGEHTDYTGGLVLPMAIHFTTSALISPREDGIYSVSSDAFEDARVISVDDHTEASKHWSDYPIGVLIKLQEHGVKPPAFSLSLRGNVPLGSGLSSSASVEVASALAMLAFSGAELTAKEIAILCRRAENEFVHSPCGIMDQFVILEAMAGHALMLNTQTLDYEHVPMNLGGLRTCKIVIINSRVKHSIAGGDYGLRRREVEAGQSAIRARFPGTQYLGEASLIQLETCAADMPSESFRRCRHILSENLRVRGAREAMLVGNPGRFGELMLAFHASMRDDFACSCDEIDFLVNTAAGLAGCYGARMTGGGFGGCTVNLVDQSSSEEFGRTIGQAYQSRFGLEPEIYVCAAADGALRSNGARFLKLVGE